MGAPTADKRTETSSGYQSEVFSHLPEDLAMAALAMDTLEVLDACRGEAWTPVEFKVQITADRTRSAT